MKIQFVKKEYENKEEISVVEGEADKTKPTV